LSAQASIYIAIHLASQAKECIHKAAFGRPPGHVLRAHVFTIITAKTINCTMLSERDYWLFGKVGRMT